MQKAIVKFDAFTRKTIEKYRDKEASASSKAPSYTPAFRPVTYRYDNKSLSPIIDSTSRCALEAIKPMVIALSRQAEELFRMKVIALLERYGIATNPETRDQVKQTPIITGVEGPSNKCVLAQTLSLFPGQIIHVTGASLLDPKTQMITTLFPDTFSISLLSNQSGFPHPSQRAGWSLYNQLLPVTMQDPATEKVFTGRRHLAGHLELGGQYIHLAKQLLKLKRKCFDEQALEFLILHKRLTRAIIAKAPSEWLMPNHNEIINEWYQMLILEKSPFETLSRANQKIGERYLVEPNKHPILNQDILEQEYQKALDGDECEHKYVQLMGRIFGKASHNIILHYHSKERNTSPPSLNEFEKIIQAAAYQHELDFIDELMGDNSNMIKEKSHCLEQMRKYLERDIAFFTV